MATLTTKTLSISIDASFEEVVADLSDPSNHPAWATEFFDGDARRTEDASIVEATVPAMGGPVHMRIDADRAAGNVDLFLAPIGAPFGQPLPVRVLHNGSGVDVLFTLTRFPDQPEDEWTRGLASMGRELDNLRRRHEE